MCKCSSCRLEKESQFFQAAREYVKYMLSDFRNARDTREIQQRIESARGKMYDAYNRMEKGY